MPTDTDTKDIDFEDDWNILRARNNVLYCILEKGTDDYKGRALVKLKGIGPKTKRFEWRDAEVLYVEDAFSINPGGYPIPPAEAGLSFTNLDEAVSALYRSREEARDRLTKKAAVLQTQAHVINNQIKLITRVMQGWPQLQGQFPTFFDKP